MRRSVAAGLALAAACVTLAAAPLVHAQGQAPHTIFVSPAGNDADSGNDPASPLRTIQRAVDAAGPGDTVQLAPGRYAQDLTTVRDGGPGAAITIVGPPDAVVSGAGGARVVQVFHDNVHLEGFTIDGAVGDGTYRDKLIYVLGRDVREGVSGLVVSGMTIQNAGGECVRIRSFSHDNIIANNTVRSCGRVDFPDGRWGGKGKNGEGIYIGTAPDQWGDGKNPTADPDASDRNWVHHNTFDTQGNECVDIKEGASGNLIEQNTCTGQLDPESAGFDSRGDGNVFRDNTATGNVGAGVRLGGHTVSGVTYGKGNAVYGNNLASNRAGGLNIQVGPQGQICANTLSGGGVDVFGPASVDVRPADPCPPPTATTLPGPAPSSSTSSTAAPAPATTATTAKPTTTAKPATTTTAKPTTTAPATTTTAPPTCAPLAAIGPSGGRVEAEAMGRSGRFQQVDDAARSGGKAMKVPGRGMRNDGSSALRLVVSVPASATYQIWVQGSGPDSASDSVWLSVDGSKAIAVDLATSWAWKRAAAVPLTSGRHTVVLSDREDGASIDQIAFSRDTKSAPATLVALGPLSCSTSP